MELLHKLEDQGNWLFKRRSFVPLILLCGAILTIVLTDRNTHLHTSQIWDGFCIFLSFLGLAVRFYTIGQIPKGTSGNTTKDGQSAISLNKTGIYSCMKHPLYFGNFIIWLGLAMFVGSWWFVIIFILLFWLYYERIIFAEEMFLKKKHTKDFEEWSSKTPGVFPSFKNWIPNKMQFSWLHSTGRECNGFFAIVITFTILRLVKWLWFYHIEDPGLFWYYFFPGGLAIYLILRILKKKTKIFLVDHR